MIGNFIQMICSYDHHILPADIIKTLQLTIVDLLDDVQNAVLFQCHEADHRDVADDVVDVLDQDLRSSSFERRDEISG